MPMPKSNRLAGNFAAMVVARRWLGAASLLVMAAGAMAATPTQIQGDRFRDADGRAVAVRWAFGLTDAAELPAYQEAGLNVVYLDLPAVDAAATKQAAELAMAAGREGLAVVVGLNPIVATSTDEPLDLASPEAVRRTCTWLADTVSVWKDVPGLLAYALEEDVEERLRWTDRGFGQYLQWLYGGRIEALNEHWRAKLRSFPEIGTALATTLDAGRVGQVGRASLDLAKWRADGVQSLLRRWSTAVAAVDPAHPVIGGRMARYRTLLAAPPELSALQPAMLERTGWPDLALHEAAAVAVANQSGRFAVVPVLETHTDPVSVLRWTRVMFGRGAAGVSLASWRELAASTELRRAVRLATDEADHLALASFVPQPSAAVLLQPLARGPLRGDQQRYGYGTMAGDEPAGLYAMLRRSTRHGPLGVLTPRDLDRVPLGQVGCLFAPAAFELSSDAVQALKSYVAGGGVLVADLGLGCYEPRGHLAQMPAALQNVFGIGIADVRLVMDVVLAERQRERVRMSPPGEVAFPELRPELAHPGSLVVTHVNALFPEAPLNGFTPPRLAGTLLRSPAAFIYPTDDTTRIVVEQASIGGRPPLQPALSGISVHPYGQGVAAFVSTFIWQEWFPDDALFDQVHDGMMGQRPQLTEVAARRLCDERSYLARHERWLWLHRLDNQPAIAQVDLPSLDGELYVGGLNAVRRPLQRGRAAPVQLGTAPLVNRRVVRLAGGELRLEETVPVALWPQHEQASADVIHYTPSRVEVQLFGAGDEAEVDHFGRWIVLAPRPEQVVLTIRDGGYPIAAGSQHRVEWWTATVGASGTLGSRAGLVHSESTMTAGADQRLVIRETVRAARLAVTPATTPVAPAPPAPTS